MNKGEVKFVEHKHDKGIARTCRLRVTVHLKMNKYSVQKINKTL